MGRTSRNITARLGSLQQNKKAVKCRNMPQGYSRRAGFFYAVEIPRGNIRIGFSENPHNRLRTLRAAKKSMQMIGYTPALISDELAVHRYLSEYAVRKKSENNVRRKSWYRREPQVIETINEILAAGFDWNTCARIPRIKLYTSAASCPLNPSIRLTLSIPYQEMELLRQMAASSERTIQNMVLHIIRQKMLKAPY